MVQIVLKIFDFYYVTFGSVKNIFVNSSLKNRLYQLILGTVSLGCR